MKRATLVFILLMFLSVDLFADHIQTVIITRRARGDVVVKSGVKYEIEASGVVRLEDGFRVEKGATFAVYPSCF